MSNSLQRQDADDTVQPQPTGWKLYAVWVLVVLLTTGMYALQANHRAAAEHWTNTPPAQWHSAMLKILGRLGVGFHAITRTQANNIQTRVAETFSRDVRAQAITPVDQVRAATILAQLEGCEAAVTWLNVLIKDDHVDESLRTDARELRDIYESGSASLSPQQSAALVARHGWFAQLALSFGKPANDPQSRAVMRSAIRAATAAIALELGGLFAALVGLGLLIWAIIWLALGKVASGYRRTTLDRQPLDGGRVFLETLAVLLIAMPVLSWVAQWMGVSTVARYALMLLLLPVVVFWPRVRGMSWAQWQAGMGWHTGRGVMREIGAGLFAYLAALPVLIVMMVVVFILLRHWNAHVDPRHPILDLIDGADAWQIVYTYALACVWAPLLEESVFRGALFHHLRQGMGVVLAALISAFIFAIIHPQGLSAVPAIMALGVTFALIREWRGSIIASATAHACNNFLVVTLIVLMLA